VAAGILLLAAWFSIDGRSHESLRSLPRTDAWAGDGDVQGVQSLGDGGSGPYSVTVYGLAADGSPIPATPTPGTPEPPVVIVPVATPIPIYGEGVEQWRGLVASIFPAWAVDKVLAVSLAGIRMQQGRRVRWA